MHNAYALGDHGLGASLLGDLTHPAAWRGSHATAAGTSTTPSPAPNAPLHTAL